MRLKERLRQKMSRASLRGGRGAFLRRRVCNAGKWDEEEGKRRSEMSDRGMQICKRNAYVTACTNTHIHTSIPFFFSFLSFFWRSMSEPVACPLLRSQTARSITEIADWIADDQASSCRRSISLEKVGWASPDVLHKSWWKKWLINKNNSEKTWYRTLCNFIETFSFILYTIIFPFLSDLKYLKVEEDFTPFFYFYRNICKNNSSQNWRKYMNA